MNYKLNDTINDFKLKYFQLFEYKCVIGVKVLNMENNAEVFLTITYGHMKIKTQFYRLNRKIKNALKNGLRFNEIVKFTIINDSSLSNINIC